MQLPSALAGSPLPPVAPGRNPFISIFVDLYPNVMISSTNPAYNLTVHNTASGGYSLKVMTIVVIVLLPVVLAYQTWTYYVFRRRVSKQEFQPSHLPGRPRPACRRKRDHELRTGAPPEAESVPVEPCGSTASRGWWIWLFIHIAFLTGYRNRLRALLTWWLAFTRDVRRKRTFTTQQIAVNGVRERPKLPPAQPRWGRRGIPPPEVIDPLVERLGARFADSGTRSWQGRNCPTGRTTPCWCRDSRGRAATRALRRRASAAGER